MDVYTNFLRNLMEISANLFGDTNISGNLKNIERGKMRGG